MKTDWLDGDMILIYILDKCYNSKILRAHILCYTAFVVIELTLQKGSTP